ncbi:response regulator transcription factor [Clostridium culturomicium]|uniref:response regulator transcription factor n=1 Tax=Clostridium culturomicium TaxID=1499683 RepID=UPI00058C7DA4|nr:response regulator transcription factor [Clostridium culturomicium]
MKKNTILILEDDNGLRIGLTFDLEAEGYEVIAVSSCRMALEAVEKSSIDLAILDVNLPDGDGFQVCGEIKKLQDIPVIFLTARDLIIDQVNGFEAGADDYVTKPFSNVLLRKRVQAILKRTTSAKKDKVYEDGYLYIDFDNFISKKGNEILSLTPTEFKLLQVLMTNGGSVVTRQMILEKLWDNSGNFVDEHALTVNINRVRSKLEDKEHKYIKTVYGLGYTWIGEHFE